MSFGQTYSCFRCSKFSYSPSLCPSHFILFVSNALNPFSMASMLVGMQGHLLENRQLLKCPWKATLFLQKSFIAGSSSVSGGTPCPPLLLHAGIVSGLIMHRSHTSCHNCCEFIHATALSCPKNTASLTSSPSDSSSLLSSLFLDDLWSVGGKDIAILFFFHFLLGI